MTKVGYITELLKCKLTIKLKYKILTNYYKNIHNKYKNIHKNLTY